MKKIFVATLVASTAVLWGCATPDPGMKPITTLEGRECPDKPDFARAVPLLVDKKDTKVTTAVVDEKAPCFTDARGKGSYSVFAIPALTGQYTIEVDSVP